MNNPLLQHYVFHYNVSDHTWSAIPRDHYKEYWNSREHAQHILRSDKMETLIDILDRMERSINYLDNV